jgi:2'-5' RNA ligase
MIPGDRLFCSFVESHEVGYTFGDWPLHLTIVPWFRTGTSSDVLVADVENAVSGVGAFTVQMGEETGFGHCGRKLVNVVELPSPLIDIEQKIRRILHGQNAWIVDETTKRRRAFRPHVTVQKSRRMQTDDTFVCDSVYIVEQKGGHKIVVNRIHI